MTKNKPNIRRAKINAKEKLARRSRTVIRKEALSDDIVGVLRTKTRLSLILRRFADKSLELDYQFLQILQD
jgi:hypothetical protein